MTKYLLNNDILAAIKSVMIMGTRPMRKEALWVLSNIAADSEESIGLIIRSGLIGNINLAVLDTNIDLRKEAIWTLSNICHTVKDPALIQDLVDSNIVNLYYDRLI